MKLALLSISRGVWRDDSFHKNMKSNPSMLTITALVLSFALATPSYARSRGTSIEGTIQTVNLQTKHATMLTKDGKTLTFRWHEMTKFVPPTPPGKGARVTVEYHELLFGENYVNSVEVRSGAK